MKSLISALVLMPLATAVADVTLAPPFADHAVLQRDKEVPVWGTADPAEKIKVTFKGKTLETTADAGGKWLVKLAPLAASGEPAELVVAGKNTLTIRDVVVGDVWFCSGQSNMAFPVSQGRDAAAETAAGNFPLVREFKVGSKVSDVPADVATGQWQVASPATVGEFTAVGYFFARDLSQEMKVPVGLMNASRGGTYIESWLSPLSLEKDAAGAGAKKRWQKTLEAFPKNREAFAATLAAWKSRSAEAAAKGEPFTEREPKRPAGPGDKDTAGGLFNGMVHPLVPYAVRGFLWYQGEANTPRAREYSGLFNSLIVRWRESFGQGDLPFYWVQLPNYENSGVDNTERAELRAAQASALALPATGQAVTIDIGEVKDNHPKNKQEVGRRLALIAKAKTYQKAVEYSGPQFVRAERDGNAMRLHFENPGGGLEAKVQPMKDFQIAGADKKFVPAEAEISGDTVVVKSAAVPEPAFVRYAWRNAPEASLFNKAGLPAAPFRTDP